MAGGQDLSNRFYPEKAVGGYTSVDGTVEFYARVGALLESDMRVLDFGAGRGSWFEEVNRGSFKFGLRDIAPKVSSLVVCDVDPVVLENAAATERVVLDGSDRLPFDDEEFDLIVSDYVFEHLPDPVAAAQELDRILKPGGWICARTPNKHAYVSLATRVVPNKHHAKVLGRVQPRRQQRDVFPTTFLLNTPSALAAAFSPAVFEHHVYFYEAEPSYHFGSALLYRLMMVVNRLMPRRLQANLFIFLRKRDHR